MKLLITLTLLCVPFTAALADDTRVTALSVDTISSTTPGSTADYTLTFTNDENIGSISVKFFTEAGSSSGTGFSFSGASFSSDTLSGSGSALGGGTEFMILFNSQVTAGTYTVTINDATNTLTEGNYTLGMSTTMNPTDSSYTMSDSFTITNDPCVDVETTTLSGVATEIYGTNAVITRGDSTPTGTSYTITYGETTVDMTTRTTKTIRDLTAATEYTFQVDSLDANGCVLATDSVTATTEADLEDTRYVKPTVNHIERRSAVAHWVDDDYVDSFDLQLWSKTRKLKTFRGLTNLKKTLTKVYLKAGHDYRIRVRATYVSDETTRWSRFRSFTTL